VLSSPVEALPALAVFGFGACLLFWFTGSLLPCVAPYAGNDALVMSVGRRLDVGGPGGDRRLRDALRRAAAARARARAA
jgi:hypothetical protein